jgi:hypothetical protein
MSQSSQQPSPKHPHEQLLDELIRLILLKVCEDIPQNELDQIFSLQTHEPELLRRLKAHGDAMHGKLRGRGRTPQSQPEAPKRITADGRIDSFGNLNRMVSQAIADARTKFKR